MITGQIEGRVTFREGQIGELTLDGGSGSSFVMQLQVDGMIRWARLFGDGATVSASVEHSSGTIVVAGMLNDSATLDALPTTAAGDGDAFLAGFDPDTGAARWITELERLPTSDADIVATDLAADEDSVVWLGRGDRGVTADGAGHQIDGTCAPAATCDVLVEIDPTDGRPLLAQGVSGQELLDAREAQLKAYLDDDPGRSNIAMVDVSELIQRHSM